MTDVASRRLFQSQVRIVLRRCRFKHRRAKIRRIAEILCVSIVGEKGPTFSKTASHIHVTCLVPALCRVLQQINAAHRKRSIGYCNVVRQDHSRQETQRLERSAWSDGAGTGRRVINQVAALQVHTMGSEVAKFQRHLWTETLLDGTTPLLDVLRRRVELHGGEANGGRSQNGRSDVEWV